MHVQRRIYVPGMFNSNIIQILTEIKVVDSFNTNMSIDRCQGFNDKDRLAFF